jgi:alpha-galactosidase
MVFAKNVLGDCILTPELGEFEIALHDINLKRLSQTTKILTKLNAKYNGKATVKEYPDRREALAGANFIINAIQVGGYKPCTVTDFDIPKKYGLRQTIADTIGVGGVMRGLRTIHVLEEFAKDIEEVCPDALFLNYTNPMSILTGYLLTHTKVKAVGLCHSVQGCLGNIADVLDMREERKGASYKIYGINHMAWLLEAKDKDGNDLYPEFKKRSLSGKYTLRYPHPFSLYDEIRHEFMHTFGYYVTESSEHSAEYHPYFIKAKYPELIKKYHIPLDEYIRRCIGMVALWRLNNIAIKLGLYGAKHNKTNEFGASIIKAVVTGEPFEFNGSVLNTGGIIPNLPEDACVEVPIIADKNGLTPVQCEPLPTHLAALNKTHINVYLKTIEAAKAKSLSLVHEAVMLDPHTGTEMSIPNIRAMCNEMYRKHKKDGFMPEYQNDWQEGGNPNKPAWIELAEKGDTRLTTLNEGIDNPVWAAALDPITATNLSLDDIKKKFGENK